jgi:DNA-binding transcriptional MerR regulator
VPELLRIGDFARASGLSVKALRHYHRIGLLSPAHTHPRTRYRYYSMGQIATVEEIGSLAALGIPLARVRDLIHAPSPVQWRSALLAARAILEERLARDRDRLAAIDARLASLGQAEAAADYRVFLSSRPPCMVGAVRDRLVSYDQADDLLGEVRQAFGEMPAAAGAPLAGVIWHDCGKASGTIDCEGLIALRSDFPPRPRARRVRVRRLPPTTTACVIHRGNDAGISTAYACGWSWITEHGYALAGPVLEWYLHGASDRDDALTEIHFPIAPRRAGK